MPKLQIASLLRAVTCRNYKLQTCYTQ